MNDLLRLLLPLFIVAYYFIKVSENKKKKPVPKLTANYTPDTKLDTYPYKSVNSILTKAEFNFYRVLTLVIVDTDFYICPMVRLADIIQVHNTDYFQGHFNRIRSKHIDFLLCDKNTFRPVIAIELDDSSHDFDNRVLRDDFLNEAMKASNLKLVRFKAYQSYKVSEIKDKLGIRVPTI